MAMLIKIPEGGVVRIKGMRGEDAVGEQHIDLSFLPTLDAAPVVRCKDCKFIHDKGYCTLVTGMTRIKPDDFCSRGEGRNDG